MTRHAYTFIEVVLAMAVTSVVLLGAQSAVMIASRALPSATSGPSAVVAAGQAMGIIADDLALATAFATLDPAAVEFTVPDRDGDAAPDVIRYSWSGTPGDPLERRFNGGPAAVLAASIQEFSLEYDTTPSALPTTWTEGAETLLFQYAPGDDLKDASVRSNVWLAQFFTPTLPADARSWSVTKVRFAARRKGGTAGRAKAQLRLANPTAPVNPVLGEVMILESALGSSYGVTEANFSFVGGLAPGQSLCFVFQWVADTDAFEVLVHGKGGASPLLESGDNAATWSVMSDKQLLASVYGRVVQPDPVQYETLLTDVHCRLRAGNAAAGLSQSWRILTRPPVPGP